MGDDICKGHQIFRVNRDVTANSLSSNLQIWGTILSGIATTTATYP